jgi:hypoxanthine phosphoribosyltransferase
MVPPETISLHDLRFGPFLSRAAIAQRVGELGEQLRADYQGRCPVFLVVLNGSFLFAADLVRAYGENCTVSFVKMHSYHGTASSGTVHVDLGPGDSLRGQDVIIVEDIVDSGQTLHHFLPLLRATGPASVKLCTLLHKPAATVHPIPVDYCGFEIPNAFVVGYGLDYDGLGRNLPDIWQVV